MKTLTTIVLFLSVTLILGCGERGPKLTPVTGTLTQNGKPLGEVSMEFRKQDTGASSFAETDAAGHFTLTHTHGGAGAVPGKYTVSIWRKGKPIPLPPGMTPEEANKQGISTVPPNEPIANSDGTPIEVEIGDAAQAVNVDVK